MTNVLGIYWFGLWPNGDHACHTQAQCDILFAHLRIYASMEETMPFLLFSALAFLLAGSFIFWARKSKGALREISA